jgi:transcriptional regulator with XRE-family HTH domain
VDVGKMIRARRMQLDLTLAEVAKRSGLSSPFLSQVERGSAGLSVTSLKQIAQALEVSMNYFLETNDEDEPVHSIHDLHYFGINGSRIRYARLGSTASDRELEPLYVVMPPKYASNEVSQHAGEEFFFVLRGELTVQVGRKTYRLGPGSAVHYKSGIKHKWRNDGEEEVHLIAVNTPRLL